MKVQKYNSAQSFGVKLDTAKVLEVTSMKIFKSEGIKGFDEVINALGTKPPHLKAYGNRGAKYYAELTGKKIMDKYPAIKDATKEILKITQSNSLLKKNELNKAVQPIIDRLGNEIDISI